VKDKAGVFDALIEFRYVGGGGGSDGQGHDKRCRGAESLKELFIHFEYFSRFSFSVRFISFM
jgi:hypothetical protein